MDRKSTGDNAQQGQDPQQAPLENETGMQLEANENEAQNTDEKHPLKHINWHSRSAHDIGRRSTRGLQNSDPDTF